VCHQLLSWKLSWKLQLAGKLVTDEKLLGKLRRKWVQQKHQC